MTERTPIACTLTTKDAAAQVLEWTDLRKVATSIARSTDGARMTFTPDRAAAVTDLAEREQTCCSFLTIDVMSDDTAVTLDISSDHPDAGPIIDMLAGAA